MQWQKYKELDFLCEQQDGSKSSVVLFHGYGADASDLASLSQMMSFDQPVDWYFPQGVLQVPIGPAMMGRAWFELRVSDFEALQANQSFSQADPNWEPLLNKISVWLNHLGGLYDNVIIGGFSQGSILASHCFYRLNFAPKGLVLWSGYLIGGERFPQVASELKVPFYQSHGGQDPVLPVQGARRLFEKLGELGLQGQWREFSGGHEIPMQVIAETRSFVNSVLDPEG